LFQGANPLSGLLGGGKLLLEGKMRKSKSNGVLQEQQQGVRVLTR